RSRRRCADPRQGPSMNLEKERDGFDAAETTQIQSRRERRRELRTEFDELDERTRRIRPATEEAPEQSPEEALEEATQRYAVGEETRLHESASPASLGPSREGRPRDSAPRTTVINSATRIAYDPG